MRDLSAHLLTYSNRRQHGRGVCIRSNGAGARYKKKEERREKKGKMGGAVKARAEEGKKGWHATKYRKIRELLTIARSLSITFTSCVNNASQSFSLPRRHPLLFRSLFKPAPVRSRARIRNSHADGRLAATQTAQLRNESLNAYSPGCWRSSSGRGPSNRRFFGKAAQSFSRREINFAA